MGAWLAWNPECWGYRYESRQAQKTQEAPLIHLLSCDLGKASHYGICGSGPQPERTVRSSHPWPVGPIPQPARLPDSTVWLHFLHMLHCPAACQLCCPGQHRHASLVSAGLVQRVRGSEGLTLAPRGGSCLATSSCNLFMYLFLCALRGSEFLVHKLAKVVLRALPLHWLPLCRFPTSVLS